MPTFTSLTLLGPGGFNPTSGNGEDVFSPTGGMWSDLLSQLGYSTLDVFGPGGIFFQAPNPVGSRSPEDFFGTLGWMQARMEGTETQTQTILLSQSKSDIA